MTSPQDAHQHVTDLRQRLARSPQSARQAALHTVIGEPGISGLILVTLAAGLGLLLDFQVTQLHPVFSIGMVLLGVPASLYWTLRRMQGRTMFMDRKPGADYMRNLALATVAGQAGCGTLIIVFAALFGGMFLDARLDTHPVFTLGLVLVAIPISLYAMIHLMLTSLAAIQPSPAAEPRAAASDPAEDDHSLKKE
jgi:F0F1-type ATP synthase assembly protein I